MNREFLTLKLPMALLGGIILQAGGAIWWAAQQGSAIHTHDIRLDAIDAQVSAQSQRSYALDRQVLDRLARVEERLNALAGSTLRQLLNRGWYSQVPVQLKRWCRIKGRIVQGLVRRREAEAELWQTPDQQVT